MEHLAIDIGGSKCQICVRTADGQVVEERRWPTEELEVYLARRPPSRVILETCAEAFRIADLAKRQGHEVRVVSSLLARALGVGDRQTKTDQRDARALSEVSTKVDLVSVHIPSQATRELKALSTARESLVAARTQLINSLRGWQRTQGKPVRAATAESLVKKLKRIQEQLPEYIVAQLQVIETLNDNIATTDRLVRAAAKNNDVTRRMMTVPGVGPVTAVRFYAALDQVQRFQGAHKVQAYLGLTPGEYSSSQRQRRTGITKAGPPAVRRALVQAAWSCRLAQGSRSHPLVSWALQIEQRRGKFVATVALARKLAGILYAIWRDGTTYCAERAAQATVASTEEALSMV